MHLGQLLMLLAKMLPMHASPANIEVGAYYSKGDLEDL